MADTKVLNIGVDFGTSKCVIAGDNGLRTFVPSYVGFPQDAVSKKLLKKSILFGEEALKNRLSVDIFRPVEKGVLKYSDNPAESPVKYEKTKDIARLLIAHLIDLVTNGNRKGYTIRGVIGCPALASNKNKQALIEISEGLLDSVLVASEPFTVAYGLNMLSICLIIDIGAGTVDLCRMHGVLPTEHDQLTTFKAGDHIDQVFFELIKKKYPDANFTVNMLKKFKEECASISKNAESLVIDLPVKGKPRPLDVTDELKQACRTIVPEIVEGIQSLVSSFDPEFQDVLKENIILAGGGSQIVGLREEIEKAMKDTLGYGKVTKVDEPVYAGANGALMLCKDMPAEYWIELK